MAAEPSTDVSMPRARSFSALRTSDDLEHLKAFLAQGCAPHRFTLAFPVVTVEANSVEIRFGLTIEKFAAFVRRPVERPTLLNMSALLWSGVPSPLVLTSRTCRAEVDIRYDGDWFSRASHLETCAALGIPENTVPYMSSVPDLLKATRRSAALNEMLANTYKPLAHKILHLSVSLCGAWYTRASDIAAAWKLAHGG